MYGLLALHSKTQSLLEEPCALSREGKFAKNMLVLQIVEPQGPETYPTQ